MRRFVIVVGFLLFCAVVVSVCAIVGTGYDSLAHFGPNWQSVPTKAFVSFLLTAFMVITIVSLIAWSVEGDKGEMAVALVGNSVWLMPIAFAQTSRLAT